MSNDGRAYERLIRDIYDQILRLDGIEDVRVEHDVTLQGLVTTHQIDVFWRFVLAGIEHQVVIQAKDWTTAVGQGAVLLFDSVLTDLPGQPRGIMVAKSGFQSGAQDVANAKGIVLYELREPEDSDFDGRVKAINFALTAFVPEFRNFAFNWDDAWLAAQPLECQIVLAGFEDELMVRNEQGDVIESLHRAKHRMLPEGNAAFDWRGVSYAFPNATYLDTGNADFPRVKLLGFSAEAKLTVGATAEFGVSYHNLFTHILTSVTGGQTYFVDKKGHVQRRT